MNSLRKIKGTRPGRDSVHIFAFCLFTFYLAVAGCAAWKPALPLQQATAEELAQLLGDREGTIQTMKGLFRAQIKGPGIPIAQSLEGAMYFRRPDALRLQGFNRLGGEVFEFVSGNDSFRLRVPTAGRVFSGRVSELDRMSAIGRPLQLAVLAMHHVVGGVPVAKSERLELVEDGDRYRLDVLGLAQVGESTENRLRRRVWFERQRFQVVQEEWIGKDGAVEATLWFEDFRPVAVPVTRTLTPAGARPDSPSESLLKPFEITMEDGQGRGTLRLTFHEMIPNPQLSPRDLGLLSANTRGPLTGEQVGQLLASSLTGMTPRDEAIRGAGR